jgi:hypothetical protein
MPDSDRPHTRASDQVLDGLTWGKIRNVGGTIALLGGMSVAVVTFLLTFLVTKPELQSVRVKADSIQNQVDTSRKQWDARLTRIEIHQIEADSVHSDYVVPLAKVQCLLLARDSSMSLARLAGLKCDKILR